MRVLMSALLLCLVPALSTVGCGDKPLESQQRDDTPWIEGYWAHFSQRIWSYCGFSNDGSFCRVAIHWTYPYPPIPAGPPSIVAKSGTYYCLDDSCFALTTDSLSYAFSLADTLMYLEDFGYYERSDYIALHENACPELGPVN